MTAEIIEGNFNTRLSVPAENVLKGAIEQNLEDVIIIGRTKDQDLYMAASTGEGPEILWLIECAKGYILSPDRE